MVGCARVAHVPTPHVACVCVARSSGLFCWCRRRHMRGLPRRTFYPCHHPLRVCLPMPVSGCASLSHAPARPRARALLCLVGAGLRLQVCQGDTLGFVRQVLLHASTRARSISRRVLPCSPSTSRCPPLLLSRWEYRHRCVCEGCAQAVGTCPMCRGAKQGVLRVFT